VGGIVVDNAIFCLSIAWFVPEIEVWSCPKSSTRDYGWVNMKSFLLNVGGIVVDKTISACQHLDLFRRHSQSMSKVARNHAKFCTFLALVNFMGVGPHKVLRKLSFLPHATSCVKASWGYSHWPLKLLALYAEFRANFWMFIVKNCLGEPHARWGVRARKSLSFYNVCKNFRGQHHVWV